MSRSLCCNSDTRIGYYNPYKDSSYVAIGIIGTYCKKCDKVCNTRRGNKYYYPNGVKIDNNEIRKMKLNKIKNIF
jgi:hypothetical protein